MNANIRLNDAALQKRLAQWALLSDKEMGEATRAIAARFVKAAVRNTPLMIATSTPAEAKREWTRRVTQNYEKKRFVRGKWLSKGDMRAVLAQKKAQLGREAAGWNAAATELNAKGVPAWVKRHSGEGNCSISTSTDSYEVTIRNSAPYGQSLLKNRTKYALDSVRRDLEGNIRAIKQKLVNKLRRR